MVETITDNRLFISPTRSERYRSIQFSFMDIRACLLFDEANRERVRRANCNVSRSSYVRFQKLPWENISSDDADISLLNHLHRDNTRFFVWGLSSGCEIA